MNTNAIERTISASSTGELATKRPPARTAAAACSRRQGQLARRQRGDRDRSEHGEERHSVGEKHDGGARSRQQHTSDRRPTARAEILVHRPQRDRLRAIRRRGPARAAASAKSAHSPRRRSRSRTTIRAAPRESANRPPPAPPRRTEAISIVVWGDPGSVAADPADHPASRPGRRAAGPECSPRPGNRTEQPVPRLSARSSTTALRPSASTTRHCW